MNTTAEKIATGPQDDLGDGSAFGPISATRNGTRFAISPEMK
jgi:hypothetical protein